MAVIDTSYFFGELSISQPTATLQMLIDSKEPELLTKLLGYELNKLYITGIAVLPTPAQKWLDLRDGKEYTTGGGALTKWPGLRFTVGTAKKSLVANYVYWHYLFDNITFTTASGQKKSELPVNALPDHKMVRAWNEMVNWNIQLNTFLLNHTADYPEYEDVLLCDELFTLQNRLGL